jgi:hypothetical protein
MSNKPLPLAFQPAPRPQALLNASDALRLAEASADLGFARPVSSPEAGGGAALHVDPMDGASAAGAPPSSSAQRLKADHPVSAAPGLASIKVDVPQAAWASLKIEAIRRRVTVKFLVLEALASQGYEIDLANVPQDGRRLR